MRTLLSSLLALWLAAPAWADEAVLTVEPVPPAPAPADEAVLTAPPAPAPAAAAVLTVGHAPPATGHANVALLLDFQIAPLSALRSAQVAWRPLGTEAWRSAPIEMSSSGIHRATLPAEAMDEPGLEYYVASVDTAGAEALQFASAAAPHPVIIRSDIKRERERATLADLRNLRSEFQLSGQYVDYRIVGPGAGSTLDYGPRYQDIHVRYRYWILRGVEYIEAGVGRLDGIAAAERRTPDFPFVEPYRSQVGFQRGWTEVGLRASDGLGLAGRLTLGADEQGFQAGLGAVVRLGRPLQTRLEVDLGGVAGFGWHLGAAFHLATVPRLPVAVEVILTNEPNSGSDPGEMARVRLGYEFTPRMTLGALASYQARSGDDHGLGAGAEALFRF